MLESSQLDFIYYITVYLLHAGRTLKGSDAIVTVQITCGIRLQQEFLGAASNQRGVRYSKGPDLVFILKLYSCQFTKRTLETSAHSA